MLDKQLTKTGEVRVREDSIEVEGFEAEDCMCREVAALAMLWAVGELQQDLVHIIHQPGGGKSCIDDAPPEFQDAGKRIRQLERQRNRLAALLSEFAADYTPSEADNGLSAAGLACYREGARLSMADDGMSAYEYPDD